MKAEHVLCIRQGDVAEPIADMSGAETQEWLRASADSMWFVPREVAEEDDAFRQVVPYVVFAARGRVLGYQRLVGGSEGRLHGLWSVGFGGHVSLLDLVQFEGRLDASATIMHAARREVTEEAGTRLACSIDWGGCRGLICEDDGVSKFHLGVILLAETQELPYASGETEVLSQFRDDSAQGWLDGGLRLEGWSRLALQAIGAQPAQIGLKRSPSVLALIPSGDGLVGKRPHKRL